MADKQVEERVGGILINFVLDKSGSMDAIRLATIDGFNRFKNDQAEADGEAHFTLTLFDDHFGLVCEAVPIREVPDLDRETYVPGGMTALFDAVAFAIARADDRIAASAVRPKQVLFVILTDGQENASHEFDQRMVFDMISQRQDAGYEFVYLGANQDSYQAGAGMGIREGRMRDWMATQSGAAEVMEDVSLNVRAFRERRTAGAEDWFTDGMRRDGREARERKSPDT